MRYTAPAVASDDDDRFSYRVCDDAAQPMCATASVRVRLDLPVDKKPKARNDNAVLAEGQASVVVGVLANDVDDGGLDPSSVRVVRDVDPDEGSVAILAGGVIAYTRGPSRAKKVRFDYEVCEAQAPVECDDAKVKIRIEGRRGD